MLLIVRFIKYVELSYLIMLGKSDKLLVPLRRSSYTLPLASLTRVGIGIKLTGIICGSGALAAIPGRTRGTTGLIAAGAQLPRRFVGTAEGVATPYELQPVESYLPW